MGTKVAGTNGVRHDSARELSSTSWVRAERLSRLFKRKIVGRLLLLGGDAIGLVSAHWAARALLQHLLQVSGAALNPRNYAAFYLPFLLAVLFVFERNQRPDLRRPEKELELVAKGVSFAFLLLICANFVVFKTGFSRYMMVTWYAMTLIALLAVRFGLRAFYGGLWKRGLARRKTLLIGSAEKLFELPTLLSIQRYRGYDLVGIIPAGICSPEKAENTGLPLMGSLKRWREVVRECEAEQVIVAFEQSMAEGHESLSDIVNCCLADRVDVQVYSDLFASREFNYELDGFSGFCRFFATAQYSKHAQLAVKKLLDFAGGILGSVITLLLCPAVALLIKMEDGGPVFYRREYYGRDCKPRYDLKFRTMRTDADQILREDVKLKARYLKTEKLVDDPRITRVGWVLRKYSIDELPQFFSVLMGELSLVGPRVISQEAARHYGEQLPKLFSVKPGLTGYWQVMGRQLTSQEEHVRMDMFYIDHWSIWLDLWIIIRTVWSVSRAEGAY